MIFYNSQWAQELGFANPPTNYAEFKEQACAATAANTADDNPDNDGTGGLVLYTGASNVASFVFANGGDMLTEDKTGYDFADQTVSDVAVFLKDLWDSRCAYPTESYPNPEFATRKALFTISSTAGLPYQVAAFEAEGAIKDEWTLIPFPGKDGGQSVDLFGQYVAIGNTNPERMMATWVFLKYLTSPEVQAQWIEGSAYYPTRSDTLPFLANTRLPTRSGAMGSPSFNMARLNPPGRPGPPCAALLVIPSPPFCRAPWRISPACWTR